MFGYSVKDPQRYGVVEFDGEGRASRSRRNAQTASPTMPSTGLYFYDNQVVEIAANLKPSRPRRAGNHRRQPSLPCAAHNSMSKSSAAALPGSTPAPMKRFDASRQLYPDHRGTARGRKSPVSKKSPSAWETSPPRTWLARRPASKTSMEPTSSNFWSSTKCASATASAPTRSNGGTAPLSEPARSVRTLVIGYYKTPRQDDAAGPFVAEQVEAWALTGSTRGPPAHPGTRRRPRRSRPRCLRRCPDRHAPT